MYFKNILLYRLLEKFDYSIEALNEQLRENAFSPCPRSENASIGWVSPYGLENENFIHGLKGYLLFAFCKEEKILPAGVITEELKKKVKELEREESREIYRKEKRKLKEEIIINLRYQAFSRKKIVYGYVDLNHQWLIIDASNRNRAEEVCSFLRKSLGSLKLSLPETVGNPQTMMTQWLKEKQIPANFGIESDCDMLDPKQKASMIKCKEQDLTTDEILEHLHRGKQVAKLALNWQNKISFEIDDALLIKKIKFIDVIKNAREEVKKSSEQEQFDADFALMAGEFSQFLSSLWSLFNGLKPND